MNLEQEKVFLNDMRYVLQQAQAYRDYVAQGHASSLQDHRFGVIIHNALLESSLAFLRKVNEFFGKNEEASVRAFFPDYPLKWLWNKEDCDTLNERVMHLSLHHAIEGDYDWTVFLNTHLPEAEKRFREFEERIAMERPELNQPNG